MKALAPAAARDIERRFSGQLPKYVRAEEYHRALELEPRADVRALLRALFELGARVSELLMLTPGDIDLGAGVARLQTLKRRRPMDRTVPIMPALVGELVLLVNELKIERGERIFLWSRQRAFELVRDALLRAGVDRAGGRASPRGLRHGHAVHALLNGVPLNIVSEALGHSSALTTSIYVRVIGRDLADYYRKVQW